MDLTTVQEIEHAIDALTPEQRDKLYVWLDEHYLQASDMRLRAAVEAGYFDRRIALAVADHMKYLADAVGPGPTSANPALCQMSTLPLRGPYSTARPVRGSLVPFQ